MSKFEVELELTGFRMRIKGERDDIPVIANNVASQFSELLRPAANIVEGAPPQVAAATLDVPDVPAAPPTKARKRRSNSRATTTAAKASTITFRYDPAQWGTPLQTWKQADKAIWLLYVSAQGGGPNEMTGTELAAVFNRDFREAKQIQAFNVNRDLEKLKSGGDALVGRTPGEAWFLTEAGNQRAVELVTAARTRPTAS